MTLHDMKRGRCCPTCCWRTRELGRNIQLLSKIRVTGNTVCFCGSSYLGISFRCKRNLGGALAEYKSPLSSWRLYARTLEYLPLCIGIMPRPNCEHSRHPEECVRLESARRRPLKFLLGRLSRLDLNRRLPIEGASIRRFRGLLSHASTRVRLNCIKRTL